MLALRRWPGRASRGWPTRAGSARRAAAAGPAAGERASSGRHGRTRTTVSRPRRGELQTHERASLLERSRLNSRDTIRTGRSSGGVGRRYVAHRRVQVGPRVGRRSRRRRRPGRRVYLDTASSEPLHPAARETCCSPPSTRGTPTRGGCTAPAATPGCCSTTPARSTAEALGVRPDEVTFTSSGTEAVHLGVLGLLRGRGARAAPRSCTPPSSTPRCCTPRRWCGGDAAGRSARRRPTARGRPGSSDARPRPAPAVVALQSRQPRGRHAPAGRPRSRGPTTSRSSSTPAPRRAGSPCPTAGRRWPASAHKWGGPAGVGVLLVRKGARWRDPFPERRPRRRARDRLRERPAVLAAAAALQAVVAERDEVNARQHALVDRIRARRRRHPRRRGRRRPGRPAAPPGHVLLPLRRRRGAGHRARPARVRGAPAARRAPRRTLEPSHVLAAMGALTHGNVRVSLGRDDDRGATSTRLPRGAARGRRGSARRLDCGRGRPTLELDCRGLVCPLPVIELADASATSPVGEPSAVVADRRRRPRRRAGVVPDARPGVRRRGDRRRRRAALRGTPASAERRSDRPGAARRRPPPRRRRTAGRARRTARR